MRIDPFRHAAVLLYVLLELCFHHDKKGNCYDRWFCSISVCRNGCDFHLYRNRLYRSFAICLGQSVLSRIMYY